MNIIRRTFKQVFIRSCKVISTKPIFLNVLLTDVRKASVEQKLMSFYSIIDRCLSGGQRVNVIVALGKKSDTRTQLIYSCCLADYLNSEYFNLVFVAPAIWRASRLLTLAYVMIYFFTLRGNFATRLNFAYLSALARMRINTFKNMYDALPCSNWLGLTGGVELPVFKFRRDIFAAGPSISALQFGQAFVEQRHFSGYSVDNLFVYDELSAKVFRQLNMQVGNMLVTGSLEFEYYTGLLCNEKVLEEERLSVIFVDQPVQQRGEYTKEYLLACYTMLQALNNDPGINLKVKLHPRGSAFYPIGLSSFSVVDDWSDCLSRSHVVIGFFSNLCDLALCSGRVTFYIGSEAVLDQNKRDWVVNRGGYVADDVDFVWQEISRLKSQYSQLASQIIRHTNLESKLASEIIYKNMVACSEAQAIA